MNFSNQAPKAFDQPVYVTRPVLPPLADYTQSLAQIWQSGFLTNGASQHQALEQALCNYLRTPHLSLFNNGTLALLVACQALQVKGEVITTPFTFAATPHVLAWNKASFTANASGVTTGWAVLACLTACLCYGLAASFTKRYMTGLPSLVSATGSQLGATVFLLPLGLLYWPDHAISWKAWGAVIALGVVCTSLAYILYFRIIERAGPAKALTVTFAIPVFAVMYGVLLLGEVVTPWMVGCGFIIIVGTTLSTGLVVFRRF